MALRKKIERPNLLWRGFVIGGIGTMKLLSFHDPSWAWWEANVTDAIPRKTIRSVLGATLAVHLLEALNVRRITRKAGVENAGAYTRTTFVYGFPEYFKAKRAAKAQLASVPVAA
jgi:hypothetical protein